MDNKAIGELAAQLGKAAFDHIEDSRLLLLDGITEAIRRELLARGIGDYEPKPKAEAKGPSRHEIFEQALVELERKTLSPPSSKQLMRELFNFKADEIAPELGPRREIDAVWACHIMGIDPAKPGQDKTVTTVSSRPAGKSCTLQDLKDSLIYVDCGKTR